jgi:hypothetical protein
MEIPGLRRPVGDDHPHDRGDLRGAGGAGVRRAAGSATSRAAAGSRSWAARGRRAPGRSGPGRWPGRRCAAGSRAEAGRRHQSGDQVRSGQQRLAAMQDQRDLTQTVRAGMFPDSTGGHVRGLRRHRPRLGHARTDPPSRTHSSNHTPDRSVCAP